MLSLKIMLRSLAVALLFLVPAAGCGSDPTGLIDGLSVDNKTDRYTFELDIENTFSGTFRHIWTNTGTIATLEIETAASGGIGTISIQDDNNAQVLSRNVLNGGSVDSQAGSAGTWIITTILAEATGTLKFTVTKK